MAYATVAELRETYLPQVAAGLGADAILQTFLDEATDVVERQLGFKFAGYAEAASVRKFLSDGGVWLRLPYYQAGSLTALARDGAAITDYEADPASHIYLWRADGWARGRYTATAKWGYGEPPPTVVGVVCQLAVNLWRGRDRGLFSDVVGVEGGGAVGYTRSLTNYQRMALADVRAEYAGPGVA
jgi:hypothetical protein